MGLGFAMKRAINMGFEEYETAVVETRLTPPLGDDAAHNPVVVAPGHVVLRLEIPRNTRYISVAREAAEAAAQDLGFDRADCASIRLAVGEACNNAVLHGNKSGACPHICLTCRVVEDALLFDISNPGTQYHLDLDRQMPEPFAEGGRGLPLIESLMDSVEVLTASSGTTVRIRKRRPVAERVTGLKS